MRWWPSFVLCLGACASATPNGNVDPDAAVPATDSAVDAAVAIDSAIVEIDGSVDPVPMEVTLSQTTNATITSGNTIVCGNIFTGATLDNSFYRVFPLIDHGVTGPFHVKSVQFAVDGAEAGSGTSQNVTVNVGTYTGAITSTTSALEGGQWFPTASVAVSVPDGGSMMMTAPIDVVIPAGSKLMVELRSPSDGNRFFPGSNGGGETYPTFWRSTCESGIPSYTSLGENIDLVMTVTGTH